MRLKSSLIFSMFPNFKFCKSILILMVILFSIYFNVIGCGGSSGTGVIIDNIENNTEVSSTVVKGFVYDLYGNSVGKNYKISLFPIVNSDASIAEEAYGEAVITYTDDRPMTTIAAANCNVN